MSHTIDTSGIRPQWHYGLKAFALWIVCRVAEEGGEWKTTRAELTETTGLSEATIKRYLREVGAATLDITPARNSKGGYRGLMLRERSNSSDVVTPQQTPHMTPHYDGSPHPQQEVITAMNAKELRGNDEGSLTPTQEQCVTPQQTPHVTLPNVRAHAPAHTPEHDSSTSIINISTSSSLHAHTREQGEAERLRSLMANDRLRFIVERQTQMEWCEAMTHADLFEAVCLAGGKTHRNDTDMVLHFASWLEKRKLKNERNVKREPDHHEREQLRRASNAEFFRAGAAKAADDHARADGALPDILPF